MIIPNEFVRHYRIGTKREHTRLGEKDVPVWVTIEHKRGEQGPKLSFTGVVGPTGDGDAFGSCGQIVDCLAEVRPNEAEGWTAALVAELRAMWERWHLNDMRAGCEHQRAAEQQEGGPWDPRKPLTVTTYKQTRAAIERAHDLKVIAMRQLAENGKTSVNAADRVLLNLPYTYTHRVPKGVAEWYEVEKTEQKTAGWVTQSEHPEGILSVPCVVCGYRYGNAWLYEEIPAAVWEWVEALPVSDAGLLPRVWR